MFILNLVAPVKDLLQALVASDLSGSRAPVAEAHSRETVQEATNKFFDAAGAPPDREQERFVRQQFEAWRERGEPIPLEEFDRLFDRVVPDAGGVDPAEFRAAMEAMRIAGIEIDGLSPDYAIGGQRATIADRLAHGGGRFEPAAWSQP